MSVVWALDGSAGIATAASLSPDLILLDIQLPPMAGLVSDAGGFLARTAVEDST
jgi:DNA-binding response OmpR family regulator